MVTFILVCLVLTAAGGFVAGTLYGRMLESKAQAELQQVRENVRKFL